MKTVSSSNAGNGRVFSYDRWSSGRQGEGDSERRQQEQALNWCRRHDCTLDERTFTDRGVSAWKGANRKSGYLGDLLKIVKSGDVILIEDADRWSRENPLDSLGALRETVNRGVEVVFLKTGVTVNRLNFNDPAVLIPNFFGSFLANQENEKRSFRIREAMKARRAMRDQGKAVPGMMPCWLRWDKQQERVVVIDEKAEVVSRIFEMSLRGLGIPSMIQKLADTPCISRRMGKRKPRWNTRFVHRILTGKEVLGYERTSGKRIYPPIVTEEQFYPSLLKLEQRRSATVPLKWENSSLFTGLCKCSVCGGSLIKTRSGHAPKYYDYLNCSRGVRERGEARCNIRAKTISYDAMENSFLALLLHQGDIIRRAMGGRQERSPVDALKGELTAVHKEQNKIMGMIDGMDTPPRQLAERLNALNVRESELQTRIQTETAKAKIKVPAGEAYEKFLVEFAEHAHEPEYRGRVREALRDIVDKIVVKLGEDCYQVIFKGSVKPVSVKLGKGDVLFEVEPRNWIRHSS